MLTLPLLNWNFCNAKMELFYKCCSVVTSSVPVWEGGKAAPCSCSNQFIYISSVLSQPDRH